MNKFWFLAALAFVSYFSQFSSIAQSQEDLKSKPLVFRDYHSGNWYVDGSVSEAKTTKLSDNEIPLLSDVNGDGVNELIVYRPEGNIWLIAMKLDVEKLSAAFLDVNFCTLVSSSEASYSTIAIKFGGRIEDIPAIADYDGDGCADLAIFRPSMKRWYVRSSKSQSVFTQDIDIETEQTLWPLIADFDGDSSVDFALWENASAVAEFDSNIRILVSDNTSDNELSFKQIEFPSEETSTFFLDAHDINADQKAELAILYPTLSLWNFFSLDGSESITIDSGLFEDTYPLFIDLDDDGKYDFGGKTISSSNAEFYTNFDFANGASKLENVILENYESSWLPAQSSLQAKLHLLEELPSTEFQDVSTLAGFEIISDANVYAPGDIINLSDFVQVDEVSSLEGFEFEWSQVSWKSRSERIAIFNATELSAKFAVPGVTTSAQLKFHLNIKQNNSVVATYPVKIKIAPTEGQPEIHFEQEFLRVVEGEEVTITPTVISEGEPSYLWEQLSGVEIAASNGYEGPSFSFVAPLLDSQPEKESIVLTLQVQDAEMRKTIENLRIDVESRNNTTPTADAGELQTVQSGALVILDPSASYDADGDEISYQWELKSSEHDIELQVDELGLAQFKAPGVLEEMTLTFSLVVTDIYGASSTDSVDIIVLPPSENAPPVANAGADQIVSVGELVSLDPKDSTDANGDSLTYSWLPIDVGGYPLSIGISSDHVASYIAPDVGLQTVQTFELTVTDIHGAKATDTVAVTILPNNRPPIAEAGEAQTLDSGELVVLDASQSHDPDGQLLTYLWQVTDNAGLTIALQTEASNATATFTAPNVTEQKTVTMEVSVTDTYGVTDTDNVSVTIVPKNNPPVADAGPDQTVDSGEVVTLDASASSDPDGDPLSFNWEVVDSAGYNIVRSYNTERNAITFNAPVVEQQTIMVFEVTVTDSHGEQSSDRVTISINKKTDDSEVVCARARYERVYVDRRNMTFVKLIGQSWHRIGLFGEEKTSSRMTLIREAETKGYLIELIMPPSYTGAPSCFMAADTQVLGMRSYVRYDSPTPIRVSD